MVPKRNWVLGVASTLACVLEAIGADWPQYLGPSRNGATDEPVSKQPWPRQGLDRLWSVPVGGGYAGPAVVEDRLYILHRIEDSERLECRTIEDGSVVWSSSDPTSYRDEFGFDDGPRATPTIDGNGVFTLSADGTARKYDRETGAKIWEVDFGDQFKARKGYFGFASSPLVMDETVIYQAGGSGDAGIVGLCSKTGDTRWTATDHAAGYSSPTYYSRGDEKHAVCLTREGLVVLDPETGEIESNRPWRSRMRVSVSASTPIVWNDTVFVSASYGAGAALFSLESQDPKPIWSGKDILSTHYATAVEKDGYVFGLDGRVDHPGSLSIRCVSLESGSVEWKRPIRSGASILRADDSLLLLLEDGELQQWDTSPRGPRLRNRDQILGAECRAIPALSNGVFYARDKSRLIAVRIPLDL